MTDTRDIELVEKARKRKRAAELRVYQSWSYQKIADALEVSVGTVRNWVREETAVMLPKEETDELRTHQLAKIDANEADILEAIAWLKMAAQIRLQDGRDPIEEVKQVVRATETLSQLRKERALLLGLNVPVTVHHNVRVRTEFDAEVEALVADLLGGGNLMTAPDEVDTNDVHSG